MKVTPDDASKSSLRPPISSDSQHPRPLDPLSAVVSASLPHPYFNQNHPHHLQQQRRLQYLQQLNRNSLIFFFRFTCTQTTYHSNTPRQSSTISFFLLKTFYRSGIIIKTILRFRGCTPGSGYQSNLDPAVSPQPHDSSPFYFHPPSDLNASTFRALVLVRKFYLFFALLTIIYN